MATVQAAIPRVPQRSRIFKIIDRERRSTVRLGNLPCWFCGLEIMDRFYLSRRSNASTKHYHIDCARRAGFDVVYSLESRWTRIES
ncbi:MAG TPA: hypothetical protein VJN71_00330 [Nitrososphaerales archaeon]|nr:hypothetical protein [Nitrososphaerales archaeon]